jgi:hypothetical protein
MVGNIPFGECPNQPLKAIAFGMFGAR